MHTVLRLFFLIGSISCFTGCSNNSVTSQENVAPEQPSDPESTRSFGGSRSETALDVVSLKAGELAISGWTLSDDGPFGGPVKAGRDAYFLKISAQNLETPPND